MEATPRGKSLEEKMFAIQEPLKRRGVKVTFI